MITLEEAVELLGKECIPKDVLTDPYYQKAWLHLLDMELEDPERGEDYVRKNKKYMYHAWDYLRTRV